MQNYELNELRVPSPPDSFSFRLIREAHPYSQYEAAVFLGGMMTL